MGYIQGEGRSQGTLFPVVLDDFVPADHMCRVIDAFVEKLAMSELGFERAQAAETGATWLRSASRYGDPITRFGIHTLVTRHAESAGDKGSFTKDQTCKPAYDSTYDRNAFASRWC